MLFVAAGPKQYDVPEVRGESLGGGLRLVGHGPSIRTELAVELRASRHETTTLGFDVTTRELGVGLEGWVGLGLGRLTLLAGLSLQAQKLSGELTGLGRSFPYDAGFGLLAAPGLGLAAQLGGLRPALRVLLPHDFSAAEEVDAGDASGTLVLLELGYEVTRW